MNKPAVFTIVLLLLLSLVLSMHDLMVLLTVLAVGMLLYTMFAEKVRRARNVKDVRKELDDINKKLKSLSGKGLRGSLRA